VGSNRSLALFGTLASAACFVDAVGEAGMGSGGAGTTGPGPTSASPAVTTSTAATTAMSTGSGGHGGFGTGGAGGEGGSCDGFLTFDGAQIGIVADTPGFAPSDAFAFGARVRLRDDPKFDQVLDAASQIMRHARTTVEAGYALGVAESLDDGAFHPIAGVWLDNGLCDLASSDVAPIPVEVWTRLDVVYERNNPAGQDLRLYRNGVLDAQRDCPDESIPAIMQDLEIGGSLEFPVRYLRGDIDDVFVKAGPGFAAVPHPVVCEAGFAVALGLDQTLASSCAMPMLEATMGVDPVNADTADPVLGCR
jgi:hypothetical protein